MTKSYHPVRVFLRYFSVNLWAADAATGSSRTSHVRTPLAMIHVTWERQAIWDQVWSVHNWRLVGVTLGLSWRPARWDYRIAPGSLLFRNVRSFSWPRRRLV